MLAEHLASQHAVTLGYQLDGSLLDAAPGRCYAVWPRVDGWFCCPVPGCPGEASTKYNMRRHFDDRHPRDVVDVAGDGIFPRCRNCGVFVNPEPRYAGKHVGSKLCRERGERLRQHERAVESAFALRELFLLMTAHWKGSRYFGTSAGY